jgi:hypothetical protein
MGTTRLMPKGLPTSLCVVATAVALIAAAVAVGAASRADFVAQVDPICKRKQQQAERLLDKAGNGNRARGKAYATIARKGRAALSEIYSIGPAPSDLVIFDRWVQKIQRENAIVVRMARSLKAGRTSKTAIFLQKATDADKRGEKVVRDFGFRYCDRSTVGTP